MKTLLQINSVANINSTGRIAEGIGRIAIGQGWNSYIAYGRSAGKSQSNLIRIGNKFDIYEHVLKTRIWDSHGFGSKIPTKRLIRLIKEINPDVILLHNLHGYYIHIGMLFHFLKENNKPVFWSLHDCWSFTGHCAYFDLANCGKWENGCYDCPILHSYPESWGRDNSKNNFLRKKELFTSLKSLTLITPSQWLENYLKKSFLKDYPTKVIHYGINFDDFTASVNCEQIKGQVIYKNKFIILGVASLWSVRKGLKDFLKLSKQLPQEDYAIILIGGGIKLPKGFSAKINVIEHTNNTKELATYYSMSDVFVNPTWEDNFPVTNLESLACGTPVITYKTGGSLEAVGEQTGFVVEKGDIKSLIQCIEVIRRNGKSFYTDNCIKRATDLFDQKRQFMEYMALFEQATST